MFLSVIIPSIGRESLKRSVESVIYQDFESDNFEVIVVQQGNFSRSSWFRTNL